MPAATPMAIKNYYLILGVARGESQEGIRAAFRELAKRLHPDRAGAESTPEFQEILEAYRVLSDPERRRHYNRELEAAERGGAAAAGGQGGTGRACSREVWAELAAGLAGRSGATQLIAMEAVLHPQEALFGTQLRMELPLAFPCPACGGRGVQWFVPCPMCGGEGVRRSRRSLRIPVALGVMVVAVQLRRAGGKAVEIVA